MNKIVAAERNKSVLARGAALALLTQLLLTSTALAQANSYIGPDDGDWHNPANWSDGVVPVGTTSVVIDGDGPKVVGVDAITPAVASGVSIGEGGTGSLSVAGRFEVSYVALGGGHNNGTGTMTVSGADAFYKATSNTSILSGSLIVENRAKAETGDITLGTETLTGHVIARGAGTELTSGGLLVGGFYGNQGNATDSRHLGGTVTVTDGAVFKVQGRTRIGYDFDQAGTLLVSGPGSTFDAYDMLYIGEYGGGTAVIENGGILDTVPVYIGHNAGAEGSLVLRGAGTKWSGLGASEVGGEGTGSLRIESGAVANLNGQLLLAEDGGTANVVVTGAGSRLKAGIIVMGADGNTDLLIADGGVVEVSQLVQSLGFGLGGSTQVMLTGANSRLTASSVSLDQGTLNLGAREGEAAAAAGQFDVGTVSLNNTAVMVFNHTGSDYVVGADISSGSSDARIRHLAGVTRLTGNNDLSDGRVLVSGGTLLVDGRLNSTFDVANARLGGSGELRGQITVGPDGIVAPGSNGVGTLTAYGDVYFGTGSMLEVELAGGGTSDLFDIYGDVLVEGGTIKAIGNPGKVDATRSHTVLKAASSIQGDFAVTSDFYFYTPELTQTTNEVTLTLDRNGRTVESAGLTGDQKALGAALDKLGPGNEVYDTFMGLSAEALPQALASASGTSHAAAGNVLAQTFNTMQTTSMGRFTADSGDSAALGYVETVTAPAVAAIGEATPVALATSAVWLAPVLSGGRIDGDAATGDTTWISGGLTGGYEYRTSLDTADVLVGVALGYQRSSAESAISDLDAGGGSVSVYGGMQKGNLRLTGSLLYGLSHSDVDRRIVLPGGDLNASADYWTQMGGLSTELTYELPVGGTTTLAPLAGVDVMVSRREGFAETGAGAFNLASPDQTFAQIDPSIGLELTHAFATETGVLTAKARAEVQHALLDQPGQEMTFAGTTASFVVEGADTGRTSAVLGAGFDYDLGAMSLFADYQGSFSSGQHQHGVRLGAKGAF